MQQQIINIETALANTQKMLDELNEVVITQGKEIETLKKQNKYLHDAINQTSIKPISEETPPPHY